MADTAAKTTNTGSTKRKTAGGASTDTAGATSESTPMATDTEQSNGTGGSPHTSEARSRFNAALEEARAGVAALGAEARERATGYRGQALDRSQTLAGDARSRAGDLATEGKARVSEGMAALAKLVGDNAAKIDEQLGAQYGDYVRSASKSLQDAATKLDQKSVDDLGNDAREFVRSSPGMAVGLAALAGYMFARILRK